MENQVSFDLSYICTNLRLSALSVASNVYFGFVKTYPDRADRTTRLSDTIRLANS